MVHLAVSREQTPPKCLPWLLLAQPHASARPALAPGTQHFVLREKNELIEELCELIWIFDQARIEALLAICYHTEPRIRMEEKESW
jgi:hypothetical protein